MPFIDNDKTCANISVAMVGVRVNSIASCYKRSTSMSPNGLNYTANHYITP